MGNIPNDAVCDMMSKSDILLSTSTRGEGWGAVINEGMSCGCAIVCSNSIGCANTLANEHNSALFKTHSVKDLVRAIKEAKLRQAEFSECGKKTVESQYNPSIAAERFATIAKADNKDIFPDGVCSKVF